MKAFQQVFVRLRALFFRQKLDADMAEEMRVHLEMQTQENLARGMSPEEARYAAQREFGGVDQIKERARAQRSGVWIEQSWRDFRFALRQLAKSPGFTIVAVLSLALGIGANTAIFSVVNEALFKPLPVPRAQELVRFEWEGNIAGVAGSYSQVIQTSSTTHVGTTFTFLSFRQFQESNQTLQSLFAFTSMGGHTVVIDDTAEVVGRVDYVSGEYFPGLGVKAVHGRTLTPADDRLDAPLVAVISRGFWQGRFGGDVRAVGKTIFVNTIPVTIVGVAPPEFRGDKSFGDASALFLPLAWIDQINPGTTRIATQPGADWDFGVMGRLKPEATVAQARANFAQSFQQSALEGAFAVGGKKLRLDEIHSDFPRLRLEPGSNGSSLVRHQASEQINVLTGLMGLMLLIACTNVANLLLARGAARRKEIAVRLALGAGRFRIIRQLLVESLLLAAGGGLLGLVFAAWGADLLAAMFQLGGVKRVALDGHVLGFVVAVSTLTGVLFGLAPALRATRIDLTAEFQSGPRTIGARPLLRLGRLLMIAQVALAFVVLAGAGLFIFTVRNLRAADLGFAREHLLLFDLGAKPAGYKNAQTVALCERVADGIRSLPGVRSATFSSAAVVSGRGNVYGVRIVGGAVRADAQASSAAINDVGPDFFKLYDLPPVQGRILDARDNASASKVAVVNAALVRTLFLGENPLGRRITFGGGDFEIIGVVRDIRYDQVRKAAPPTIYTSFAQRPWGFPAFAVRTTAEPQTLTASIRSLVHDIDPKLPIENLRTQEEQLERLFGSERMFARLATVFGGLALVLVCVGLYGLMSYAVQRRTGEIGVRMALGALPTQVLEMVLSESLRLVAAGLLLGIAVAYGAIRLIQSMLFGLSPADPVTYGGVAFLLIVVGLLASWLPARRAARIDPVVALRTE